MIKFRDTNAGCPIGRQATKTDLVDMLCALGAHVDDLQALDRLGVEELRNILRGRLPGVVLDTSRQATRRDLLGIATALGCELKVRPHSVGKNMPTEELRAWIRALLSVQFFAGELVVTPNGQRAVVIEQGARVAVRLLVGHTPLEHFWPYQLRGTGERA
jgi:hypothetical protein